MNQSDYIRIGAALGGAIGVCLQETLSGQDYTEYPLLALGTFAGILAGKAIYPLRRREPAYKSMPKGAHLEYAPESTFEKVIRLLDNARLYNVEMYTVDERIYYRHIPRDPDSFLKRRIEITFPRDTAKNMYKLTHPKRCWHRPPVWVGRVSLIALGLLTSECAKRFDFSSYFENGALYEKVLKESAQVMLGISIFWNEIL